MQIYGPSYAHGPQAIKAPHAPSLKSADSARSTAAPSDELQLSDAAQLVEAAGRLPEVRQDRVDAIRAQIAAGTYETDAKIDSALDRLLDEIA